MEFNRDVLVVIATFGSDDWKELGDAARERVFETQTVVPTVGRSHRNSLAEARNAVADIAIDTEMEWLVFLDADDELDPQFVEALGSYEGDADILQTSVRGFIDDDDSKRHWLEPFPVLHPQKFPLIRQNYLTIGSPIRTSMFEKVGGFDDWPVLEDWALWLKCQKAGAEFDTLPEAVYYINDDHYRNVNGWVDETARLIRETYR